MRQMQFSGYLRLSDWLMESHSTNYDWPLVFISRPGGSNEASRTDDANGNGWSKGLTQHAIAAAIYRVLICDLHWVDAFWCRYRRDSAPLVDTAYRPPYCAQGLGNTLYLVVDSHVVIKCKIYLNWTTVLFTADKITKRSDEPQTHQLRRCFCSKSFLITFCYVLYLGNNVSLLKKRFVIKLRTKSVLTKSKLNAKLLTK